MMKDVSPTREDGVEQIRGNNMNQRAEEHEYLTLMWPDGESVLLKIFVH